jgi:hypothetical protein
MRLQSSDINFTHTFFFGAFSGNSLRCVFCHLLSARTGSQELSMANSAAYGVDSGQLVLLFVPALSLPRSRKVTVYFLGRYAELVEQSFARHIALKQEECGFLVEWFLKWFSSCIVILASVELAVLSFDQFAGKRGHSRIGVAVIIETHGVRHLLPVCQ